MAITDSTFLLSEVITDVPRYASFLLFHRVHKLGCGEAGTGIKTTLKGNSDC